MGITATVIDPADLDSLERVLEEKDVTLFFSESPTNPYLRCVDVRRISQLCHAKGAIVCIDSTFATPINQRAIELGADLVIHSATKYLGGHNDVLGGILLCANISHQIMAEAIRAQPAIEPLREVLIDHGHVSTYADRSLASGIGDC